MQMTFLKRNRGFDYVYITAQQSLARLPNLLRAFFPQTFAILDGLDKLKSLPSDLSVASNSTMATEGSHSKVGEVKVEERIIEAREKDGPMPRGSSLGERVHELRERVRELEEWNDGTLSDSDGKHKRGQR